MCNILKDIVIISFYYIIIISKERLYYDINRDIYNIYKSLDVGILWFIFYYILKYIRKNVKLTLILREF